MPKKKKKTFTVAAENNEIDKLNEGIRQKQALSQNGIYIDIINTIISKAVIYKNHKDGIRANVKDLGIEYDQSSWFEAEKFLGKLKKYGCFKKFTTATDPVIQKPNSEYIFFGTNIKKLRKHKFELAKELEPSKQKKNNVGKKNIIIDLNDKGIYQEDKEKNNYPIKNSSKRAKIIKCLKNGKKDAVILSMICGYNKDNNNNNLPQLSKEINAINTVFTKKLALKDDIIIHKDTGGYDLNKDIYNIKFKSIN